MVKYLSLDYGEERVGVAVSYGTLAEPLTILPNNDQLLPQIQDLISEHQIQELVVGVPDGKIATLVEAWLPELKKTVKLPVHLADETLTSQTVRQKLASSRYKKKQHTGPIDHFAAAEILQEWMEEYGA